MTDETEDKPGKEKPLIPQTAAGAAIVGIPLASLLAFAGWTGEKLLAVDEIQQQHATQLEELSETQDEIRLLGVKLDERLVRVETLVEVIKDEQEDRQQYFRKQKQMLKSGQLHEANLPTGDDE
jgi:hypothetical protein